jgi:hypothetical protein
MIASMHMPRYQRKSDLCHRSPVNRVSLPQIPSRRQQGRCEKGLDYHFFFMCFFALNGVAYAVHFILGRVTGLGSEPAFVYKSNRRDIARLWIEKASSDTRDRSTVCHALQRIEMLRHSDPGIDGLLAILTHEIKAAPPGISTCVRNLAIVRRLRFSRCSWTTRSWTCWRIEYWIASWFESREARLPLLHRQRNRVHPAIRRVRARQLNFML